MRSYITKSLAIPLVAKASVAKSLIPTIALQVPILVKKFSTTTTSRMPVTPNQENLSKKNAEYAANFTEGDLPLAPAKKYAIVTCMDARINASAAYGIDLGDAHVIRNAGGSAVEALRSLVISQQLLGTKEIIIFKHTGCGMLTFSNADGAEIVRKNLGEEAVKGLAHFNGDFLTFKELEQALRDDVQFLKDSKLITDDVPISGWIHELSTGTVKRIV